MSRKVGKASNVVEPRTARSEAARSRLKAAAQQVMNRLGYGNTRVIDITTEAGVASGLFYRYFPDLQSLAIEMVDELIARYSDIDSTIDPKAPDAVFERLRAHYVIFVDNYADNPGLMRALHSLGEASPSLTRRVKSAYDRHLEFLATGQRPAHGLERTSERAEWSMLGEALSGLGDAPLTAFYSWRTAATRSFDLKREEIVEWLTVLAYRVLVAKSPPDVCLKHRNRLGKLPTLGSARKG